MTAPENVAYETDNPRRRPDRLRAWRREKVWEYRSMGCSVDEIADILKAKPEVKISHGTVINDLKAKEKEVRENFANYIDNLPMQHSLAVTGLDRVIKEGWRMYSKTEDPKILAIISGAIMNRQAVLGDPAQIQKAIKAVARLRVQIPKAAEEEVPVC